MDSLFPPFIRFLGFFFSLLETLHTYTAFNSTSS